MVSGNDIIPPVEFSGEAQLMLFTRYGDPREIGWENKWINVWHVQAQYPWFPSTHIRLHKHFQTVLDAAFKELENEGLHLEIKSCDECFVLRTVTENTEVLSVHSWGAGIDLNSGDNPLGSVGKWSHAFIEIMQKNKIFCGQAWEGRKDPKHFSMVNG